MMSRGARRCCAVFVVATLLTLMLPLDALPVAAAGPDTLPPGLAPPARNTAFPQLDSLLAQVVSQVGTRPARELAASAPVSRDQTIAVTIRLTNAKAVPAIQSYLAAHGATVANTGTDLIEAYVPVTELGALSAQPGVASVEPILPPQGDVVTSQGTTLHNSPFWNAAGFTGNSVKVGVIDVGFRGYTALIGTEVPAPAAQLCYTGVGISSANLSDCDRVTITNHGTAVTETVRDIAPGATIYISNPVSSTDTRNAVSWMHSQGVQVINYSVGWTSYWGPGNGTSPYTNSPFDFVNDAVADGIIFVNSAGNDGNGSWIGPYSGSIGTYLNFSGTSNTNAFSATVNHVYTIRARWEDVWGGASRDIDLYVYHFNGTTYDAIPTASSTNIQDGAANRVPSEFVQFTAPSTGIYGINLYHRSGAAPAWLQITLSNGPSVNFQNKTSSIGTPAESANPGLIAISAAPYSNPTTIETFSSQGPTLDNRIKPDLTGADCADTVTYGPGGPSGFCGTSQASPHVAGLAALVLQRFPSYTPVQVANYLKTNAIPRGAAPDNVWGAGFADAPESVSSISPAIGPQAGGTQIQLTGVGIGATSTVTVGSNPCTSVLSVTGVTISCVTPSGSSGNVNVVVVTNAQTLTVQNGFTYRAAPNPLPGARSGIPIVDSSPSTQPGPRPSGSVISGVPSAVPSPR